MYNGVELQEELGLGMYQTMFRLYDPAIGRFTQIDPLADFMSGINPYSFGFDNPILYGDPDGLGPIKDLWRKIKEGAMALVGKRKKGNWDVGNVEWVDRAGKGGRSKSSSSSSARPTPSPQIAANGPSFGPLPSIGRRGPEFAAVDPPSIDREINSIPDPFPVPEYKGRSIHPNRSISFTENIRFRANSDYYVIDSHNGKILSDLIKTLKDYSQLQLFIIGNTGTDGEEPGKIYGNSDEALNQGATLNGERVRIKDLMNARAKAIYQALIENGIDASRIDYGPGTRYSSPKGRTTSFVLKNK